MTKRRADIMRIYDPEFAERAAAAIELAPRIAAERPGLNAVGSIIAAVSIAYQVPIEELKSPRKTFRIAHPRQVAMAIARMTTGHSLFAIGRQMGGRDHTTIRTGYLKFRSLIEPMVSARDRGGAT